MRRVTGLIAVIAVAALPASGLAAGPEPDSPEESAVMSAGAGAFDAFCSGCHKPQELARAYFSDAPGDGAAHREAELAAFLGRHGGCPHRNHEDIAAWLRHLAETP